MNTDFTRRRFLADAVAAGVGLGLELTARGAEGAAAAAGWKAGAAKVIVTPDKPLWMGGFAARKKPSEGTLLELHAKALALEDPAGHRAVLVSADLVGFPPAVSSQIAEQAQRRFKLERDRVMLLATHTHSGPVLHDPQTIWYMDQMSAQQVKDVEEYAAALVPKIVAVIGDALADLKPARIGFGNGKAEFGVNRRKNTPRGVVSFTPNPDGPVDHSVPVLRVDDVAGRPRVLVFGYAAHSTCLLADNLRFCGDYPGFAQQKLEARHPGMMAMFVQGCGGDVMVSPRGTVDLARGYGEQLAAAALKAADAPAPVGPMLRTAMEMVPVGFAPGPDRKELQARLSGTESDQSRQLKALLKIDDVYWRRHARESLKLLDRGQRLPAEYPYPLQVWQLGGGLTLIALGGEAVVDYSLRLKKELGADGTWVAAYANDAFAYIPSRRVLEEGGYEGGGAAIGSLLPGPFAANIEETIVAAVHKLVKRVRGG